MRTEFLKKVLLLIIPIIISGVSHAQMPDWSFFRDRDGNRYYFDQQGIIHVTISPGNRFIPVNPRSIDYHIHHGMELLRSGYKVEGVTVLKSIIALPTSDNRVLMARERAVKALGELQKRDGPRYTELYRSASPVLYRIGTRVRVINEEMRYSLDLPVNAVILKKKIRRKGKYTYFGITLGAGWSGDRERKEEGGGYRFLIAVDSERYPVDISGLERAEENWRHKALHEGVDMVQVSRNRSHAIYEFKSGEAPFYSGFEGVYLNGSYTLLVRLITPAERFSSNREDMRNVMRGITIVSEH